MEENDKRVIEELNGVVVQRQNDLNKAKTYLSKVNQQRDPQTYKDGEEEIKRRQEELYQANEDMIRLQELIFEIEDLEVEKLENEKKQKEKLFNKVEQQLSMINKQKDPQTYKDGLEEFKARKKELDEINDKLTNSEKKLKKLQKEKLNLQTKYKIKNNTELDKDNKVVEQDLKNDFKTDQAQEQIQDIEIETEGKDIENGENLDLSISDLIIDQTQEQAIDKEKSQTLNQDLKNEETLSSITDTTQEQAQEQIQDIKDEEDLDLLMLNSIIDQTQEQVTDEEEKLKQNLENEEDIDLSLSDSEVKQTQDIEKKPTIVYNSKDNTYNVNFFKNSTIIEKAKKLNTKKDKIDYIYNEFGRSDLDTIFGRQGRYIGAKRLFHRNKIKKMAKDMDVQLLKILYRENPEYAKAYINQLEKGKEADKEKLPYSMTYDLTEMTTNKEKNGLKSWLSRAKINDLAQANNYVAEFKEDKKLLKVPVLGKVIMGVAASALTISSIAKKINSNKKLASSKQLTLGESNEIVNNKDENNQDRNTTKQDPISMHNITEKTKKSKDKSKVSLNIGDKIQLEIGDAYYRFVGNEKKEAKIGEKGGKPAGIYIINKAGTAHNNKDGIKTKRNGTNIDRMIKFQAKKLGVDPSEMETKVHLCQYENNVGPVGWLDMDYNEVKERLVEKYRQDNDIKKTTTVGNNEISKNDNSQTR